MGAAAGYTSGLLLISAMGSQDSFERGIVERFHPCIDEPEAPSPLGSHPELERSVKAFVRSKKLDPIRMRLGIGVRKHQLRLFRRNGAVDGQSSCGPTIRSRPVKESLVEEHSLARPHRQRARVLRPQNRLEFRKRKTAPESSRTLAQSMASWNEHQRAIGFVYFVKGTPDREGMVATLINEGPVLMQAKLAVRARGLFMEEVAHYEATGIQEFVNTRPKHRPDAGRDPMPVFGNGTRRGKRCGQLRVFGSVAIEEILEFPDSRYTQ